MAAVITVAGHEGRGNGRDCDLTKAFYCKRQNIKGGSCLSHGSEDLTTLGGNH